MITREISIAKGKNVIHSLVFYPIRDPTNDLPHSRQASSKGKMSYTVLCFTQSGIQPMIFHTRGRQAQREKCHTQSCVLPNQVSNQWSPTLEASKLKGKNVIHSLVFYQIRDPTNDLPHSRQASSKGTRYDYNLMIMKSPKPATDNRFKK